MAHGKHSRYYSKIARDYIYSIREKEDPYRSGVYVGDTNMMEDLATLFGWDNIDTSLYYKECEEDDPKLAKFKFVLDKLDKESGKRRSIFKKVYINCPEIVDRPTRCFILKEFIQ